MKTKLYRAMNNKEADETLHFNSLSWNKRFKWFGTWEFVTTRVQDGEFNNSKFVDRYNRLLEFEVLTSNLDKFNKCGYREYMLDRRKASQVRITSIKEVIL